ncbi:hypothetical protein [Deinococcus altitudinis]
MELTLLTLLVASFSFLAYSLAGQQSVNQRSMQPVPVPVRIRRSS